MEETRVLHCKLPLATIQENTESADLDSMVGVASSGRPTTPLEPSERGPQRSVSRGGGARWSGRGEEGRGHGGHGRKSEMDLLNESTLDSRHQLLHTEDK